MQWLLAPVIPVLGGWGRRISVSLRLVWVTEPTTGHPELCIEFWSSQKYHVSKNREKKTDNRMHVSDIIYLLWQNYEENHTCCGSVSMKDSFTIKWNVHLYNIILTPWTLQWVIAAEPQINEKEDKSQRDWQSLSSSQRCLTTEWQFQDCIPQEHPTCIHSPSSYSLQWLTVLHACVLLQSSTIFIVSLVIRRCHTWETGK